MRTRHLLVSAAAVLLATATLPTAASAAERSLTVTLPASINALENFGFTWEGDSGDALHKDLTFAKIQFLKGDEPCTPTATLDLDRFAGSASSAIDHAGGFRGADQVNSTAAGTVRVCGYLRSTAPGAPLGSDPTDELLFTTTVTVNPRKKTFDVRSHGAKAGTYRADAASIVGGGPDSSLTFVIKKGKTAKNYSQITSFKATGIPAAVCFPGETAMPTSPTLSSKKYWTLPNEIIGRSIEASWKTPSTEIAFIAGGNSSTTSVSGTFVAAPKNFSCRAGFGFTATRISSATAPVS